MSPESRPKHRAERHSSGWRRLVVPLAAASVLAYTCLPNSQEELGKVADNTSLSTEPPLSGSSHDITPEDIPHMIPPLEAIPKSNSEQLIKPPEEPVTIENVRRDISHLFAGTHDLITMMSDTNNMSYNLHSLQGERYGFPFVEATVVVGELYIEVVMATDWDGGAIGEPQVDSSSIAQKTSITFSFQLLGEISPHGYELTPEYLQGLLSGSKPDTISMTDINNNDGLINQVLVVDDETPSAWVNGRYIDDIDEISLAASEVTKQQLNMFAWAESFGFVRPVHV